MPFSAFLPSAALRSLCLPPPAPHVSAEVTHSRGVGRRSDGRGRAAGGGTWLGQARRRVPQQSISVRELCVGQDKLPTTSPVGQASL